ncbi:hypothetical protein ATCV1_z841R [Acanthocystis turfacea chlorella virus 1]|uniref:Uncharacterized protein z841R n=1 Tax=Chlorovirus heliozoae TaxID=322019 RepID=A7KAA1_9PHYC|nr:hypothetical protein ATCV1_z841R [Acanthocystis turfacea chlorella virus 1]ABT16975.1 hypothetical protein ATCV1_z841R [Acanthocystis turfacea chlorella virus 1]
MFVLSKMPVSDTPRSLSSSVFFFHIFRRYGNLEKVLWTVPMIVATRIFFISVSLVSVALTTTSVRLQN